MKMNKVVEVLALLLILNICSFSNAIELYEPDYNVEIYATYSHSSVTGGMAFDQDGYLYTTHYPGSSVWQIAPDGTVRKFANVDYPRGIVWTGGTNFGNYLYVIDFEYFTGDIVRIDQYGVVSHFARLKGSGPTPIAIDRTGKYGGLLYLATRGDDRIYCLDPAGNEFVFSSFPYAREGGGPTTIAFDTTGKYGGFLYVATSFTEDVADLSGLFLLDTDGTESRFTNDLVKVYCIAFSPDEMFGQYLYATGMRDFNDENRLWRIDQDGQATLLGSTCNSMAFGPDGALYVSEYSEEDKIVIISRITKAGDYYYVDAENGDDLNNGRYQNSAFVFI